MSSIEIVNDGSLRITTLYGTVQECIPKIIQVSAGERDSIEGGYSITGNIISFDIDNYDEQSLLIIDPIVSSTYIGGAESEQCSKVVLDSQGRPVITEKTYSEDFPTTTGPYELSMKPRSNVFISVLSKDLSSIHYSTVISGSVDEDVHDAGLVLDLFDRPIMTGNTCSNDFPTTEDAFQAQLAGGSDAFVCMLSADLSVLLYSSYLGGSQDDYRAGIVRAQSDRFTVTGCTYSTNFPVTSNAHQSENNGGRDVFITTLPHDLSTISYSTYIGGNGSEEVKSITLDSFAQPIVTGFTSSTDFPVSPAASQTTFAGGSEDIFISILSEDLSTVLHSTYLGGSKAEKMHAGVAVGKNGWITVSGVTVSEDYPVTSGAVQTTLGGHFDLFVTAFSPDLETVVYSTFVGGIDGDSSTAIAFDSSGNLIVVGDTHSDNFPVTENACQRTLSGPSDVFVCELELEPMNPMENPFNINHSIEQKEPEYNDDKPESVLTAPDFENLISKNFAEHGGLFVLILVLIVITIITIVIWIWKNVATMKEE